MSSAKITLFGMYDWLKTENVDMFDAFKFLPSDIDTDTLTGIILTEGGEFEPLYANPYMMKDQVQMFVTSHLRTFTKWVDALNIEYNPLENYDRMEEWNDTSSGTSSHTSNQRRDSTHNSHTEGTTNDYQRGTSNDSSSGTQSAESSGSTTGSGSDSTDSTTTNEVSAYDATGYSPHDKSTVDTDVTSSTSSTTESSGETTTSSTSSGNTTNSSNGSTSGNDYGTESESITDGTQGNTTGSNHRVGRAHGNIGVTTSQQMLESEMEVARFNIYQQIADLFIDELLLAVYI